MFLYLFKIPYFLDIDKFCAESDEGPEIEHRGKVMNTMFSKLLIID